MRNTSSKYLCINKYKKYFGYISITTGIIITTIVLSTYGLLIIPLVIGGYFILNGLMAISIKIN